MGKRPVGVTLLALLQVLGGLGILAVQLFVEPVGVEELDGVLREHGQTFNLAMVGFFLLALFYIAGGVGFWLGRAWGWWIGTYVLFQRSLSAGSTALFLLVDPASMGAAPGLDVTEYVARYGGRAMFGLLFVAYLFRPQTRRFFGLEGRSSAAAVAVLFVSYLFHAFAMAVAGAVATW